MALRFYKIAELLAAAKAIIRGAPATATLATEQGTDIDLTINAAARLFQGTQVAAAHIAQQIDPQKADAQGRDGFVDLLGITFAKDATPARGLMAIELDAGGAGVGVAPAGTLITFAGERFVDGVERTFRTLQDARSAGFVTRDYHLLTGSGIHKLLPMGIDGILHVHTRAFLRVTTDAGASTELAVVKSANVSDQSVDLVNPIHGNVTAVSTNRLYQTMDDCVVEVECVTPGKIGNVGPAVTHSTSDEPVAGTTPVAPILAYLLGTAGGGDAVGDIDGDSARVVRIIEDTLAMPPSFGNAQHWREIALACPDVDLDDAIVYRGVRGPGTVDIVCIGRSGSVRASAFPNTDLSFVFWGNNQRCIGEAQAEIVERWCQSQAAYFDDIKVRSVEWDWRGNTFIDASFGAFIQSASGAVVTLQHQDGYGPDCGVALDVTPYLRDATRLYSPTNGVAIDASLRPGDRVWATVGHATSDVRHAFATVVTTVLSISSDRMYATIADVSALGTDVATMNAAVLQVLRWGSAGPLTQPCLDAVFAYYDQLGPGSYTEAPRGPAYMQHYFPGQVVPSIPGSGLNRWPPEGRRWNSSLRSTEIRALLMAIPGVHSATITPIGNDSGLLDFDPAVFKTLACVGCVVRHA